jgi:ADP-heptose:LPS heptosyltransferase
MRLLLIRLDRIGDLVLTLPVDQSLSSQWKTDWWIPQGLGFVTSGADPFRAAKELSKSITFKAFFSLFRELRRTHYDAAIVFHAPGWVSLLLWLARIPIRGGVKSQWHSFLFLNRAIRQKRSRAEMSELEYNYQLVENIFDLQIGSLSRETLVLRGLEGTVGTDFFNKFKLQPFAYSVVHPGMGGSALNWPTDRYAELIERLSQNETVVITGTKGDAAYLAPLRDRLEKNSSAHKASGHPIVWLDGKINGPELITTLANARTITAPSTGVMHLAASTGRPTLGIFSPVRVQHPKRWGPHGNVVATLVPNVKSCPGTLSCLGEACGENPCMSRITIDQALAFLNR